MVAQLGARMHYAVPRILAEAKMLEHFYIDICAVQGWPRWLRLVPDLVRPAAVRRLLSRVPHGVPPELVTAFNDFGREYARRRNTATSERFAVHLWAGTEFCRRILKNGFGGAGAVFTFNSAGLEILQRARREGLRAVMEQTIAPMRVELELSKEERARFADWEIVSEINNCAAEYCQREEAEWQAAEVILCGSEFVRDGIAQCGGPVEKCVVVPYGVDIPSPHGGEGGRRADEVATTNLQPSTLDRPLRVLTVGTVGLRKGSPYVLEAAKQLKGKAVFRMVGSIGVTSQAQAQLREYLELTGQVPRSDIAKHFAWADVFLLPSLCEGSATVTYEALGYGLPVICTPNTGSVARDGMEGFIVPVRDATAIAGRIERLAQDVELRAQMAAKAKARAAEFTVAAYGRRLLAALTGAVPLQESISA
ncbi:MAG: glycosyltransferase family 4 protein [Limisphaerales bacterium]